MSHISKIARHPSHMRLAAALFPEEDGSHVRVIFHLEPGESVECTVVSINTDQGQLIVKGSYTDYNGNLKGFYEANLVGNKTFTFKR